MVMIRLWTTLKTKRNANTQEVRDAGANGKDSVASTRGVLLVVRDMDDCTAL
jgi:hypothetical protein